jgi:aryl-alcohol dehydrogenase-like predicted oxidoreductase
LDAAQSARVIHAALDLGVTFIDTAAVYGQGRSESFLGAALRGRRAEVVLATKFNFLDLDGDPAERVRAHCEQSLRRLETDRIDLFQVHLPTDVIGTDDLLTTLAGLREAGKIRAYGSSNYAAWRVAESALPPAPSVCPASRLRRITTACCTADPSRNFSGSASATASR